MDTITQKDIELVNSLMFGEIELLNKKYDELIQSLPDFLRLAQVAPQKVDPRDVAAVLSITPDFLSKVTPEAPQPPTLYKDYFTTSDQARMVRDVRKQIKVPNKKEVAREALAIIGRLRGEQRIDASAIKNLPSFDPEAIWERLEEAEGHIVKLSQKPVILGGGGSSAAASASTFLALTDTPSAMGTSGQILQVNGSGDALVFADSSSSNLSHTTVTGSYTAGSSDDIIFLNDNTGTVVLPTPGPTNDGKKYVVKCISNAPTSANVQPLGGTLDGTSSYIFSSQNESVTVFSTGSAWFII